jgi:hypothetical protein
MLLLKDTPDTCVRCNKPIEPRGFCHKFGPFFDMWLCDACVEMETDYWEQED